MACRGAAAAPSALAPSHGTVGILRTSPQHRWHPGTFSTDSEAGVRLEFIGGPAGRPTVSAEIQGMVDTATYKEALLKKRGEILSSGGGVKPLQTTMGDVNSR